MITNDLELSATKERIAYFERLLAQLRVTSSAEEFPLVAGGYRAELELMNSEVVEYLTRHANSMIPTDAAANSLCSNPTESVS